MGFHLYFAGGDRSVDDYLQKVGAFRLFSYGNEKSAIVEWKEAGYAKKLFVDSGAFSVAHSGKTIDIDAYIDYINSNLEIPIFVELDVIPYPVLNATTSKECAEASWKNYLYMKKRTNPKYLLPLYHFGESKDNLRRILNTEVNGKLPAYIGMGGRHGVSTDAQKKYFHEVFSIIQKSDNPNVKVHAFGMTVIKLLEQFPFYSADSTTWLKLGVAGNIITKSFGILNVSERQKFNKDNINSKSAEIKDRVEEEVNAHGYTLEELSADYHARLRFNIDMLMDWAKNYQYKGPKTFVSHRLF